MFQKTVNGKVDFVIPDAQTFRKNPLRSRVVACKRTVRERWTQIIPEARNQGIFYLLTIDPDLSAEQPDQMTKRRVYLVVPASLKTSTYSAADNVITIDEFLGDTKKDMEKLGLLDSCEEDID